MVKSKKIGKKKYYDTGVGFGSESGAKERIKFMEEDKGISGIVIPEVTKYGTTIYNIFYDSDTAKMFENRLYTLEKTTNSEKIAKNLKKELKSDPITKKVRITKTNEGKFKIYRLRY